MGPVERSFQTRQLGNMVGELFQGLNCIMKEKFNFGGGATQ